MKDEGSEKSLEWKLRDEDVGGKGRGGDEGRARG